MKKITFLLGIIVITIISSMFAMAQDAAPVAPSDLKLEPFSEIVIDGNFKVFLSQGTESRVHVDAEVSTVLALSPKVEKGTLMIGFEKKKVVSGEISVHITIKDLTKLTVSGTSVVETQTPFQFKKIAMILTAATITAMDIAADNVSLELNKSAKINLTVQAKNITANSHASVATIAATTAADVEVNLKNAATLVLSGKITKSEVKLDDHSKAEVSVDGDKLIAKASGTSTITLKGTASSEELTAVNNSAIYASNFIANDATASLSKSSIIEVNSRKTLKADMSGASKLSFTEHSVKKTVDSNGSINFKFQ